MVSPVFIRTIHVLISLEACPLDVVLYSANINEHEYHSRSIPPLLVHTPGPFVTKLYLQEPLLRRISSYSLLGSLDVQLL